MPVLDKAQRTDGTFSRSELRPVEPTSMSDDGATSLYRASEHDCDSCGLMTHSGAQGAALNP